jgi:hypothetical protein
MGTEARGKDRSSVEEERMTITQVEERWEQLDDFPAYEVSDQGEVRSIKSGRILRQNPNQFGVYRVGLVRDRGDSPTTVVVARLVADYFVQGKSLQFDTPINLNGDREDNRAENLAWRPRWFAVKFFAQFAEFPEPLFIAPLECGETGMQYANSRDCAMYEGLLEKDILKSILNASPCFPTWQIFQRV